MTELSNPFAAEWVTLPIDESAENPPRYKIKPLDGLQQQDVIPGLLVTPTGDLTINGDAARAALRYGLVGWENQTDAQGKPIEYSRDNVRHISGFRLVKIVDEIIAHSRLSDAARKNS